MSKKYYVKDGELIIKKPINLDEVPEPPTKEPINVGKKVMWGILGLFMLVGILAIGLSSELRWTFADAAGIDYQDRIYQDGTIESENDYGKIISTIHSNSISGEHYYYINLTNNLPNSANFDLIIQSKDDSDKILDTIIYERSTAYKNISEWIIVSDDKNGTNGTKLIEQITQIEINIWQKIDNETEFTIHNTFEENELKEFRLKLITKPKTSGKFDVLMNDLVIVDPTWSYGGVRNQGLRSNGTTITDTGIIFNFNVSENSTDDYSANCSLMLGYGSPDVLERNTTIYGAGMSWHHFQNQIDVGAMGCSGATGVAHDPDDDTIWVVCRLSNWMLHVNLTTRANMTDGFALTDGTSTTYIGLTFDNNTYLATSTTADKNIYRYDKAGNLKTTIDHTASMNNDISGITFNGTDYFICDYNNNMIGSVTQTGANNTDVGISITTGRCEGLDMNSSVIYVADATGTDINGYLLNGSLDPNFAQNILTGISDISIDGSPAYLNGNITNMWYVDDSGDELYPFKSEVTEVANHTIGIQFNSSFQDIYWTVDCWSGNETLNSTSPFWVYTLGTAANVPQVSPQFPADSSSDYTPYINFTFNVSDPLSNNLDNCTLFLNGIANTTDTSITPDINQSINLTLGYGEHLWKVGCYNNISIQGNSTERNYTRNISTVIVRNQYPENNSIKPTKFINFTYNVSLPFGSISSCNLYLNNELNTTDSSITTIINQTFNLTLNNSQYWDWFVECVSDVNVRANSSEFSFVASNPPTTPNILSPNNDTTWVGSSRNLTCDGSIDTDGDPINYEFYAGNDVTSIPLVQNSSLTTFNWTTVTLGKNYWRCRANDNVSDSAYTPTRRFAMAQLDVGCTGGNSSSNMVLNFTFNNFTEKLYDVDYATEFIYWGSSQTQNVSNLFNTKVNESAICITPYNETFTTRAQIFYEKAGYRLSQYNLNNYALTNSTSNVILYLLPISDGIYVTFVVVNIANQQLQGVYVTANRTVSGTTQTVYSAYTDGAGSVTPFLDPDYSHTFRFELAGYDVFLTTLTPTQSSYTITLGAATITSNETTYARGISSSITPTADALSNDTIYNFSYTVSSSYYNLDAVGFNLYNGSEGGSLTSTSCTGGAICSAATNFDTDSYNYITMEYYYTINGNKSGGNKSWYIKQTYAGNYSLWYFFTEDLSKLEGQAGWSNFSRSLIAFIIIFILTGLITFYSGVYAPMAIMVEIWALVAFFEYVGFIAPITSAAPRYFMTVILGLIVGGYFIYEYFR